MRYVVSLVLIFFLIEVQNTFADLNAVIEQNVKDATASYNQLGADTEQMAQAPRLWVHVRNIKQEKAVKDISSWLNSIVLNGIKVSFRPIQLVESGPSESQLRFFKQQDREQAEELLIELKKVLPVLQLRDFSNQFKDIGWIKRGHYELWLAPNVDSLKAPQ